MLSKLRMHENEFARLAQLAKVFATLLVAILAVGYSSGLYAAVPASGQDCTAAVAQGSN
ncbi:MAG TPA: hypothetical protein VJ698_24535 [Noviherbaspirillum sp.]|uniref:hypothetical protein n=1 Tax=Noviherbaspirillum sp. TaxID=1926288 RepID=UPI002B4A33F6|nr:hypothetical protein [Noviherbaspirillum sp.]HJV88656.1 hypothetical protein [Noviherbaspirillum sp.]